MSPGASPIVDTMTAANDFAPQFSHNQIVRGRNFGVFVVLGTRLVDGVLRYIVKEINPANLTETAPGEMQFTADMLRPYY